MTAPIVETTAGRISGVTEAGVHRFLGVPYGASTTGAARHRPAAPPTWSGTWEATAFGPTAPQAALTPTQSTTSVVGAVGNAVPPTGEDCLVLNVWTPGLDDAKRPVMVWLHGGGFTALSGSTVNGKNLAAHHDTVMVSLNHRLNLPGFLYLDEIAPGRYENSGILGMLDIVAALEWVRDNIAAFGGDPSNVTIFGCSGGGLKVSTLLAMPPARGLFHRAIVQAGPYTQAVDPAIASDIAERSLDALGITADTIERLDGVPIDQLLDAQTTALAAFQLGSASGWPLWTVGPVVGGTALPVHPFEPVAPAASADVPLIIGNNKNEAMTAVVGMYASDDEVTDAELERRAVERHGDTGRALVELYRRTRPTTPRAELLEALMASDLMWIDGVRIAERKSAEGPAPVFMYRFDYPSNLLDGRLRSCHSLEVPFVMDVADEAPIAGTSPDRVDAARVISTAWAAFARTGDPNYDGLPTWRPYTAADRSRMLFGVTASVEPDPTEIREGLQTLGLSFNPPVGEVVR